MDIVSQDEEFDSAELSNTQLDNINFGHVDSDNMRFEGMDFGSTDLGQPEIGDMNIHNASIQNLDSIGNELGPTDFSHRNPDDGFQSQCNPRKRRETEKRDPNRLWEKHRPQIIALLENHTLKYVMERMAKEHRFDANENQYKYRLRTWGVRKNINNEYAMAMIRQQNERKRIGKLSSFKAFGKNYSPAKLKRHQKRNHEKLLELASKPAPEMLRELICMTPPASPLCTPRELEGPERALYSARNYFVGAFESGIWTKQGQPTKDPEGVTGSLLPDLMHGCSAACQLFNGGKATEGRRILSRAMVGGQAIVRAESPFLLFLLIDCARLCYTHKRLEIAQQLSWYMSEMIKVELSSEHPLCVILCNMTAENFAYEGLTSRLVDCMVDNIRRVLGTTHLLVVSLESLWHAQNYPNSIFKLQTLKQQCHEDPGCDLPARLGVSCALVECLWKESRTKEAKDQALQVMKMVGDAQLSKVTAIYCVAALDGLSDCEERIGRVDLAEMYLREAYEIATTFYGTTSPNTIISLATLERKLLVWGKAEAAAEIREQLNQVLPQEDEEE